MTLTVEQITLICQKLSKEHNDTFDIPVKINKRLISTFGKVTFENKETYTPILMEFSAKFLETSSYDSILSVIKHEWAHYYCIKSTGKPHGHDNYFKSICRKIGCVGDTTYEPELLVSPRTIYKYSVYCDTCGEDIAHYSRMCRTLKEIDSCSCSKCKQKTLSYIKNF